MTNQEKIAELNRIEREHDGILNPHDVVDDSRPQNAPLHGEFVWDDSIAGERYRVAQARRLISIRVQYTPSLGGEIKIRSYTSLPSHRKTREDGGGYLRTVVVLSDSELRLEMLTTAIAEMDAFRRKYKDLIELCDVFDAMKEAKRKHEESSDDAGAGAEA